MFCQTCGAFNSDSEAEYCARCRSKLLIVSGRAVTEESGENAAEETGLEEHLLERISSLEEVVRREGEMLRTLFESYQRLEKSVSVVQSGIVTLQEALEQRGILSPGETTDRWQARSEERLQAVEMRERLLDRRDRIVAGFGGGDREAFLQKIREAESHVYNLDAERGLRALEEAYRLDRGNADLGFFVAESHFAQGELERAGHVLRKVLAATPAHYEAVLYTGIVASESGDAKAAEAHLRRAAEIKTEGFLAHFALGGLLARQARFDEALSELSRACEIAPVAAARILLGQVRRELGDLEGAIEAFEQALREEPQSEEANFQLGMSYLERNWPRKALEAFQRALAINPRRLELQEAVRTLKARPSGSPAPGAGAAGDDSRRAEECAAAGRLRQALSFYRRALRAEPDNGTIRVSYAMLCAGMGLTKQAVSECRRVLASGAEEMVAAAACSTLAELLRVEGKSTDAIAAVRDFLERHDSPAARTIGFYELAACLADSEGDLNEALDYASRALDAAPEELKSFPLSAMGWVYFKKKDYDAAIELLRRSCERAPSPATLQKLGMAYLAAGRPEEAKTAFRKSKTAVVRGAGLEERILEQVRSNQRLLEMAGPRRKT